MSVTIRTCSTLPPASREKTSDPTEPDPARVAHLAVIRAGSRWLDADEAAAYTKRSVKTIENWTSAGKVHPRYPDRRPLYDRLELDEVIAAAPQVPPGSTTRQSKREKVPATN